MTFPLPLSRRIGNALWLAVPLFLTLIVHSGCQGRSHRLGDATPEEGSVAVTHVVAAGETLSSIAALYKVEVDGIVKVNRLTDINLAPGQHLVVPGATMPASILPPPPTAKPLAGPAFYIPRAQWTSEPILTAMIDPMGQKIWRITVHHSADVVSAATPVPDELKRIEAMHKEGKRNTPFACIGYHFIISSDGRVWEGRPLKYQGAHADGDNNKGNIGICLLGNFEIQSVPTAQRDSLIRLLDRLRNDYQIARGNVFSHEHFNTPTHSTLCPGINLLPIVAAYARGQ